MGEACKRVGDEKICAGPMPLFASLSRVSEIALTRRSNITNMGLFSMASRRVTEELQGNWACTPWHGPLGYDALPRAKQQFWVPRWTSRKI